LTFALNGLAVADLPETSPTAASAPSPTGRAPVILGAGSLYEPVAGQRFDLIVTNPPFVIAPPSRRHLVYREGRDLGDDLMRRVVAEAGEHLADGGKLVSLGNWAHVGGQPWEERLAGWAPPGCDLFAIQREVLDPYEYAEIWLADAGLAGQPSYRRRLEDWVDYFARLQIDQVGLGWILLQRNQRAQPALTMLDWPQPVTPPLAAELAAHFDAITPSRWPESDFLAARWRLATDACQESISAPGAADPSRVVLRRQKGLGRWLKVDPALGGLLGACDGELPLAALLPAVASLTGEDPARLRARLLPQLRQLVAETWLSPV